MSMLLKDLQLTFRTLLKNKGFTCVAVLTLAMGIGPNVAIFSVINAVLFESLPYKEPDSLVMVMGKNSKLGLDRVTVSSLDFKDYLEQNQVFNDMTVYWNEYVNLTGGDKPESVLCGFVTANYFSVLGTNMHLGRSFMPGEDQPGSERIAIISYPLWQQQYGASTELIGNEININGGKFTVVGVTPRGFQDLTTSISVWIPMPIDGSDMLRKPSPLSAEEMRKRGRRFLHVIAALKPNVSVKQSQIEMETIASRLEQQFPDTNENWGISVIPLREHLTGNLRSSLLILFGAVGLVLLISCTNVVNLLMARGVTRTKEIAIRLALGASRRQLVRQLLTESLVLALLGGVLGFLLAHLCLKYVLSTIPESIPRINEIGMDVKVLGFTILVSTLSGVIFGLIPALRFSKSDLNETLKEGGKSSVSSLGTRIRGVLVVSEMALALVLVIAAGLMIKSLWLLGKVDPGFDPKNILTMQLHLPAAKYATGRQKAEFYRSAIDRIAVLPGVESAGATIVVPLVTGRNVSLRFNIDGRAPASPGETPGANYRAVSYNYFGTMGISFLKGRDITERDTQDAPGVIIVNQTLARRYFPDEEALGKRITLNFGAPVSREIVGIVEDIKASTLDSESGAEMYVPFMQTPWAAMVLVARTSSEPEAMTNTIVKEIQSIDPEQPVLDIRTMEEVVASSVSRQRFSTFLLIIFAAVAQVLAAIGIYGVMAYSMTQRTQEIGIRMALGAQRRDVLRLIVGQGMKLALLGLAVGLLLAFGLTRVMSSLLYGVSANDPLTFAVMSIVLCVVALLASLIPASKATSIDPLQALRHE